MSEAATQRHSDNRLSCHGDRPRSRFEETEATEAATATAPLHRMPGFGRPSQVWIAQTQIGAIGTNQGCARANRHLAVAYDRATYNGQNATVESTKGRTLQIKPRCLISGETTFGSSSWDLLLMRPTR